MSGFPLRTALIALISRRAPATLNLAIYHHYIYTCVHTVLTSCERAGLANSAQEGEMPTYSLKGATSIVKG